MHIHAKLGQMEPPDDGEMNKLTLYIFFLNSNVKNGIVWQLTEHLPQNILAISAEFYLVWN